VSPLIGVIEGGIDLTHPDMRGVGLDGSADPTGDPSEVEHGTAVSSVIAAAANGQGILGVWPGARTAVFSAGASCSATADAIDRAVAADAKVLNMSYGFEGGCFTHQVATQLAYAAGTVRVAAAGNDFHTGNPQEVTPGTDPHVITVAALAPDLSSAFFSNENYAVDLAAPGVSVPVAGCHPRSMMTAPGTATHRRAAPASPRRWSPPAPPG
jgi:Subtilase family